MTTQLPPPKEPSQVSDPGLDAEVSDETEETASPHPSGHAVRILAGAPDKRRVEVVREFLTLIEERVSRQRQIDAELADLYAGVLEGAGIIGDVTTQDPLVGETYTVPGPPGTEPREVEFLEGVRERAYRGLRADLSAMLLESEYTTDRHLSRGFKLRAHYPQVLATLAAGEISATHANIIVDVGNILGSGDAPEVQALRDTYTARVLEYAVRMTARRLQPIAKRIAEELTPTPIDERHEEAQTNRCVWLRDLDDGMAELTAYLPAVAAYAVYDRLTRLSEAIMDIHPTEADAEAGADADGAVTLVKPARRRKGAIRADLVTDLLLTGAPTVEDGLDHITAQVQVITTAETLAGGSPVGPNTPATAPIAELAGHGPIDSATAKRLAANTKQWTITTLDPASGIALSVDRYRPSEQMRRFLYARDEHCRFPGCRVQATRCDLDHTIAASQGGKTSTDNLAALCRGHHVLKHHTDWRVQQPVNGILEWTSPTGRTYVERPSTVRFLPTKNATQKPPPF